MKTFIWVTPAFSRYSPLDHTWVTSYDNRITSYPDIHAVNSAGELYWYCKGDFHKNGGTPNHHDGFIYSRYLSEDVAKCLVENNLPEGTGTIKRYGIHGVCHQITNQVIYTKSTGLPDLLLSKGVRGYALSTTVYGKYGRRKNEWYEKTVECCPNQLYIYPPFSELVRRLLSLFPIKSDDELVITLETMRINLLSDIDTIGYSPRKENETHQQRTDLLNDRIIRFINEASEILRDFPNEFNAIFGIEFYEEIDLIDPNQFVFPNE